MVRLVGVMDERFDAETVMPWMVGTVVLDTSGVERITSFGIRALLALMDAFGGRVDELYHMGCSVAFVQQVGIIRRLLGGGKVVSFQVPYIDPRDRSSFSETLAGEEGRNALLHRRAPLRSCPDAPERLAMFDDNPDTYFCFGEDFEAELPEHVAVVLESLRRDQRERPIEKDVTADGTTLWIRRALTRQVRWSGLFRGNRGRGHAGARQGPELDDRRSRRDGGGPRSGGRLNREPDGPWGHRRSWFRCSETRRRCEAGCRSRR